MKLPYIADCRTNYTLDGPVVAYVHSYARGSGYPRVTVGCFSPEAIINAVECALSTDNVRVRYPSTKS